VDPAHANPIAFLVECDAAAQAVDPPNHFVAQHNGKMGRRRPAFNLV
jgi:hypothetical protein